MAAVFFVYAVVALLCATCSAQNGVGNTKFNVDSTYEPCVCDRGPCFCVVYYLCTQDLTIITTGDEILDQRFGVLMKVDVCPGVQVCCRSTETNTTQSSTSEPPVQPPLPPVSTPPPPSPRPPSVLPTKQGCGLRGTAFDLDESWTRINIDDGTTAFAEFPWMLALLQREAGSNLFLCGASLINTKVALTAAHCVRKWPAQDLIVRAGEWNTSSADDPIPHQDRFVSRIILHPEFTKGSLFNDMALLELDSPFQEAINVGVVCLPDVGAQFQKQRCIATGWGRDSFGIGGQEYATLRKVDLPIIEASVCQERLRTTRLGIFFRLDKSFICAGGEANKDTCKGDGGGPLMCQSLKDRERYIQAGIVSWGIGCKDRQIPAVYTNVALLRNWIDSQLSSMGLENTAIHP